MSARLQIAETRIQLMPATNLRDLRQRMAEIFEWKTSPVTGREYFNLYTWWREPEVITGVGDLLAEPFRAVAPQLSLARLPRTRSP